MSETIKENLSRKLKKKSYSTYERTVFISLNIRKLKNKTKRGYKNTPLPLTPKPIFIWNFLKSIYKG